MLTNKFYKYPIMILMLAVIGFACSDSNNNSDSATVNGSVEQSQAKAKTLTEGTVVTMATVTANGSINTIEGAETTTDANGKFSLSFDASTAQNYVVVAENNGAEAMGFLSTQVENGQSIQLKPIDTESTAESNVFARLVAQGDADLVTKSDIEAMVTSTNESEVRNSASLASQFAVALASSAEARADFFANEVEGNGEEKLNATLEILADAQTRLEADLSAASSTQAETEAYDLFLETSANAFVSAGVEANKAAQAIEIWGRVLVNNINSASTEIKNSVRSQTSIMAGIAIDAAVRAEAEASEMSNESKQAIADAGVQLKAALRTAVGVKADVEAAFENYQEEVQTAMENDSSIEANFVVSVNTEINSQTGAKTIFENAISSTTSADVALTVFATFFSDVQSTSEDNASATSMSSATLEAATNIIILTNLAS
ncbi:MAG: hypothetical protein CL671_06475 [Balneola sp.]|jgi:hypothetical protein|nr:hypothetical protein [Balneola sp.]MAO78239.1 hypothetical protein [Balneola sp.]MBF64240.1 hypothetical protein [Balneola sp.]HCI71750.1 hypothetical protein [Balneola sp.]